MTDPAEIDVYVGAALREARLSRGHRQDDLARMLGVDRSTIARYESGERAMSVNTLVQVARLLNRPLLTFLPDALPNEGLRTILQVLERRPDFIPRILDLIEVSLQSERDEGADTYRYSDVATHEDHRHVPS
jgi:transcriptional regulator with XRE-family HTH domain